MNSQMASSKIHPKKRGLVLAAIVAFAVATLFATPFLGSTVISFGDLLAGSDSSAAEIFWKIRVPRVLLGFLCGSALAVSGLAYQAIFRNPLATPFTLGVSFGASFGAAAFVRFGIPFLFLGLSGTSVFAFLGATVSIFLVYGITRSKGGLQTTTMLLAGVAVSYVFSSLILFIQYTSNFAQSFQIVRWLMGGLETVGYEGVLQAAPFAVIGMGILASLSHEFNLMVAGEDAAIARGVDVRRVKRIVFFASSLMIGGVVAVCGPIGFVGMMSPHICRLLLGLEHRYLVPATICFGGAFLALCDTIARIAISPAEMPVGIITAIIGGPFFLWLLVSNRSVGR